jgi:hypothetical protein
MLSLTTVLEVRRLLAAGELSQRAIAAQVGVSRGIVSLIANGRRHLHGAEPAGKNTLRRSRVGTTRCPGCGGLVYLPCLLCSAAVTSWCACTAAPGLIILAAWRRASPSYEPFAVILRSAEGSSRQ